MTTTTTTTDADGRISMEMRTTGEHAIAEGYERPPRSLFNNRELSWLAFNQRVLEESRAKDVPLLERLKFHAIVHTNLDEFFMVRVAGLKKQVVGDVHELPADGATPSEVLAQIRERVHRMVTELDDAFLTELLPELAAAGIGLLGIDDLPAEEQDRLRDVFHRDVFPALTPLAIDPGHPFPHLRNRSVALVVLLSPSQSAEVTPAMAVVQVPRLVPRLVRVSHPGYRVAYVRVDDLIAEHISELFPGFHCRDASAFRVTRNFDLSIEEEEAEDLLETIEAEVRRRQKGAAVRLEVESGMPARAVEQLRDAMELGAQDVFYRRAPLSMEDLVGLGSGIDTRDIRDEPFSPVVLPSIRDADSMVEIIRSGDILLHHPYESFDPVVAFVSEAADDPNVIAIKQTLYRTSGNSPIVRALSRAAENGKEVTALVEIKARFDEENNIGWARALESSGVHVVYGLVGFKTHCKVALVVRREEDGTMRRYVHFGTGNYNPSTARLYTDLSFFTCREAYGEDASALFNLLTSCTAPPTWQRLTVAPLGMHERVLALIEREAENARQGRSATIRAKLNSLVDPDVIMALYRASQAGVRIDLCVRGICCLRPGVAGVSDNIRVVSVIDRFLEHSRIFAFEAGGAWEVYIGSADWMPRNFHRRVEVMLPIEDEALRRRLLDEILAASLDDNCKASELRSDGSYVRVTRGPDEPVRRSQAQSIERAKQAYLRQEALYREESPFVLRPKRTRPTAGAAKPSPVVPPGGPRVAPER
ncbi:MAG: polyphosphate kinase 1 [Deltaproteobacteria bacterium]|nr:polyphosphate kinase 1 [Deltaproteobacteria bacterium]